MIIAFQKRPNDAEKVYHFDLVRVGTPRKINFFFVFPNSTHEDGFRELSYALLAQKKT